MVSGLRSRFVLAFALLALSLFLLGAKNVESQVNGMQSFFSAEYGGVSLRVDASKEAFPGGDITIAVSVNATADGVRIEYLNVVVYGFINGTQQILLNSTAVMATTPLQFNETVRFDNTIVVPTDVWGVTYGQVFLRYAIKDLPSTERNPGFPLTTVRNIYLENLESQLRSLNQSHSMLSEVYKKLTTEYAKANAELAELIEARTQDSNDLYGTRTVATVLTITTVFFVATTLYLVMRRSKDYW